MKQQTKQFSPITDQAFPAPDNNYTSQQSAHPATYATKSMNPATQTHAMPHINSWSDSRPQSSRGI
jgi:hypothetical protein